MDMNAANMIRKELLEDDQDIRSEFLERFGNETSEFVTKMADAFGSWENYDQKVGTDMRRAYVAGFFFNAINNLIASTKLLLSGYSIPSGNLVRQTLEAIWLAILCSCKKLTVYEEVAQNKFSSRNAGKKVLKHSALLNTNKETVKSQLELYNLCHDFSHSSLLSLAHNMAISSEGRVAYVGASFDDKKLPGYKKEVAIRIELASLISAAIDGLPDG